MSISPLAFHVTPRVQMTWSNRLLLCDQILWIIPCFLASTSLWDQLAVFFEARLKFDAWCSPHAKVAHYHHRNIVYNMSCSFDSCTNRYVLPNKCEWKKSCINYTTFRPIWPPEKWKNNFFKQDFSMPIEGNRLKVGKVVHRKANWGWRMEFWLTECKKLL